MPLPLFPSILSNSTSKRNFAFGETGHQAGLFFLCSSRHCPRVEKPELQILCIFSCVWAHLSSSDSVAPHLILSLKSNINPQPLRSHFMHLIVICPNDLCFRKMRAHVAYHRELSCSLDACLSSLLSFTWVCPAGDLVISVSWAKAF